MPKTAKQTKKCNSPIPYRGCIESTKKSTENTKEEKMKDDFKEAWDELKENPTKAIIELVGGFLVFLGFYIIVIFLFSL